MVRIAEDENRRIMQESSLARTKGDCVYHVAWIPKCRRRVLYGECRREAGRLTRGLLGEKPGIEAAGGTVRADHIHLCVRVPPKYSVSDIMGYVEGKSALILNDRRPEWGGRRQDAPDRRGFSRKQAFWPLQGRFQATGYAGGHDYAALLHRKIFVYTLPVPDPYDFNYEFFFSYLR